MDCLSAGMSRQRRTRCMVSPRVVVEAGAVYICLYTPDRFAGRVRGPPKGGPLCFPGYHSRGLWICFPLAAVTGFGIWQELMVLARRGISKLATAASLLFVGALR